MEFLERKGAEKEYKVDYFRGTLEPAGKLNFLREEYHVCSGLGVTDIFGRITDNV